MALKSANDWSCYRLTTAHLGKTGMWGKLAPQSGWRATVFEVEGFILSVCLEFAWARAKNSKRAPREKVSSFCGSVWSPLLKLCAFGVPFFNVQHGREGDFYSVGACPLPLVTALRKSATLNTHEHFLSNEDKTRANPLTAPHYPCGVHMSDWTFS